MFQKEILKQGKGKEIKLHLPIRVALMAVVWEEQPVVWRVNKKVDTKVRRMAVLMVYESEISMVYHTVVMMVDK